MLNTQLVPWRNKSIVQRCFTERIRRRRLTSMKTIQLSSLPVGHKLKYPEKYADRMMSGITFVLIMQKYLVF